MSTLELPGYRVVRDEPPVARGGAAQRRRGLPRARPSAARSACPCASTSRHAYAAVVRRPARGHGDAARRRGVLRQRRRGGVGAAHRARRRGRDGGGRARRGRRRQLDAGGPARLALPGNRLRVAATSPGTWADGTDGADHLPRLRARRRAELDVRIAVPGEPAIQRAGLAARRAARGDRRVGAARRHVRRRARGGRRGRARPSGPAQRSWTLDARRRRGARRSRAADYLDAVVEQAQVDEIALVCAPGPRARPRRRPTHDDVVAALATPAAARAGPARRRSRRRSCAPADVGAWRERIARALPDRVQRRARRRLRPVAARRGPRAQRPSTATCRRRRSGTCAA